MQEGVYAARPSDLLLHTCIHQWERFALHSVMYAPSAFRQPASGTSRVARPKCVPSISTQASTNLLLAARVSDLGMTFTWRWSRHPCGLVRGQIYACPTKAEKRCIAGDTLMPTASASPLRPRQGVGACVATAIGIHEWAPHHPAPPTLPIPNPPKSDGPKDCFWSCLKMSSRQKRWCSGWVLLLRWYASGPREICTAEPTTPASQGRDGRLPFRC